MDRTIAERLAEFVVGLEYAEIPALVAERSKMRILDYLGVAIAGSQITSSRIMTSVVKDLGGKAESTLVGEKQKVSCTNAALANATMAQASDFDDDHRSSTMHPGSVVIPAAVALAERAGANGRLLVEAIVAGYEVACRVGDAFLGTQYDEGFHPTGTCGVFSSAAAAAKILRLPLKETTHAFGIAGTQAAGLEEWKKDGSWIKRMHGGKACHSGILAALLAEKGYTGPATIFEGKYGFLNGFSFERNYDASKITQRLGEDFVGHQTAFKPYPCGRFLHQIIDGVLKLVLENGVLPDQIGEVKIKTFQVAIDTHMNPAERRYRPQTNVDAQFSLPFVVGAAIARQRVSLSEFTEQAIRDPEILRIASKVNGEADSVFTDGYPERFPSSIEISLVDRRVLRCYVDLPSGDPANADYIDTPSKFNDEIIRKFLQVVSGIPPFQERGKRIVEFVRGIEKSQDISELGHLLAPS